MKQIIYISLITLFTISVNAQEREHLRAGNDNYESKDFAESEVDFRKAISENQNSEIGHYNLGNSIFRQERNDEAIAEYDLVAKSSKDKFVKAKAYHNKGNALMNSKKLQEAIEAYKNSLRNNFADTETRYNLALAQKMLKDQQQQQDKKDEKKKEDQEKKDIPPLTEYAKNIKNQADIAISKKMYFDAFTLMDNALKKDASVQNYNDFINRLSKVSKIDK